MAYVKLPLSVTDYSSGYQSVNQLRDNFDALQVAWDSEHAVTLVDPAELVLFSPTEIFGQHNTPKVPRAVFKMTTLTTGFNITTPVPSANIKPVVTGVSRLGVGAYFVGITGLQEFYAVVTAEQSSNTPQRVTKETSYFGGNGTPVGISIELYENSAGGFALTDYDFSVHIYGDAA